MKKSYFSITLAFIALLLFSCADNSFMVKDRNFGEEIDRQQNLIFTFNKDLVGDSLLNLWEEAGYIKFTPAVKGKFKWASNNELIFSPDLGFAPSTEYKAVLTDSLFIYSDKKYSMPKEYEFNFHTPYLNITDAGLFWGRREDNKSIIELKTDLRFNYKVNPQDLVKLARIYINDKEQRFDLTSTIIGETISFSIPQGGDDYDEKIIKIEIEPGLKCVESNYSSRDKLTYEAIIPAKGKFQIISADGNYTDEKAYINVITNQEVGDQDIKSHIKISPTLPFTIELTNAGFFIKGDFKEGNSYELTISKSLKGIFGGPLPAEFKQSVV
ncbi:MAG TPA: alpha-2-macroglobulin family protein, partial [Cytophagaceae bacterium]